MRPLPSLPAFFLVPQLSTPLPTPNSTDNDSQEKICFLCLFCPALPPTRFVNVAAVMETNHFLISKAALHNFADKEQNYQFFKELLLLSKHQSFRIYVSKDCIPAAALWIHYLYSSFGCRSTGHYFVCWPRPLLLYGLFVQQTIKIKNVSRTTPVQQKPFLLFFVNVAVTLYLKVST